MIKGWMFEIEVVIWFIVACVSGVTYYYWPRIRCFLGFHYRPLEYGGIHILKINYDQHAITYANKLNCPNCGKTVSLDWSR